MKSRKNIGIMFTILGLLMTCCLCPAALNAIVFLLDRRTSLYGQVFARLGRPLVSTFVHSGQIICTSLLALVVLVVGIIVLVQAKDNGASAS